MDGAALEKLMKNDDELCICPNIVHGSKKVKKISDKKLDKRIDKI